jgi:hypothetical protein
VALVRALRAAALIMPPLVARPSSRPESLASAGQEAASAKPADANAIRASVRGLMST